MGKKRKKSEIDPDNDPKPSSNTDTDESDANDITDDEAASLQDMVNKQLAAYVRKNKIKDHAATLLANILQEYLSSCLVLGYDFSGRPVTIVSVNNQQDADALGTQINRFLMQSQGMNGGHPDEPPLM